MVLQKLGKCLNVFRSYVEECDLFAPNILLRYKNDTQFKTLTSALISIMLITVFAIIFSNRFISTVNKQTVSLETSFIQEMDPKLYTINTSEFMFVIGLENMNLNLSSSINQTRYFDIGASKLSFVNGVKTQIPIILEPCKLSQWSNFGSDFSDRYNQLKLNQWLCPINNENINIQGKFTSKSFQFMKIYTKKCTGSDCATNAQLQAFLNTYKTFKMIFYYTKTVLNPEDKNPVVVTLDDSVYTQFSLTLGATSNLFMESYTIRTDQSLWPSEQVNQICGITNSNTPEMRSYSIVEADDAEYTTIFVRKSPRSKVISRTYVKYDEILSYLGGLFGIITFAFAIPLYYYNLCCYELSLATNMFTYKKRDDSESEQASSNDDVSAQNPNEVADQNKAPKDKIPGNNKLQRKDTKVWRKEKQQELKHSVQKFNFLVFLGFLPYFILKMIGADKLSCEIFQPYYEAIKEIRKHVDIGKILQKLTYTDRMSKCLLDEDQRNLLHVYSKQNICQVVKDRIKFKLQTNVLQAKKDENPYPGTKNILQTILKIHQKPQLNERQRSDIKKLSSSYRHLQSRQDDVSKRILGNIDPEIIQILRRARRDSGQALILPEHVDEVVDIEIKSQICEQKIRRVNSNTEHFQMYEMQLSNQYMIQNPKDDANNLKMRKSISHNV